MVSGINCMCPPWIPARSETQGNPHSTGETVSKCILLSMTLVSLHTQRSPEDPAAADSGPGRQQSLLDCTATEKPASRALPLTRHQRPGLTAVSTLDNCILNTLMSCEWVVKSLVTIRLTTKMRDY